MKAGDAMNREWERVLVAKLRRLLPERVAEVEDFVDFLRARAEERRFVNAVSGISEAALREVWDNPDDADYDRL
jgi:hypothetical protein